MTCNACQFCFISVWHFHKIIKQSTRRIQEVIYSSALPKTHAYPHTESYLNCFDCIHFSIKIVSGGYSVASKTVYYEVLQTWKLFPTVLLKLILQQFIHSCSSPTPSRYKEIYVTSFNIFEDHHQFAILCHLVLSNYKASVKLKIKCNQDEWLQL